MELALSTATLSRPSTSWPRSDHHMGQMGSTSCALKPAGKHPPSCAGTGRQSSLPWDPAKVQALKTSGDSKEKNSLVLKADKSQGRGWEKPFFRECPKFRLSRSNFSRVVISAENALCATPTLNTEREKVSEERLSPTRRQKEHPEKTRSSSGRIPEAPRDTRLWNSYLWVLPRLLGVTEVIFHCML